MSTAGDGMAMERQCNPLNETSSAFGPLLKKALAVGSGKGTVCRQRAPITDDLR